MGIGALRTRIKVLERKQSALQRTRDQWDEIEAGIDLGIAAGAYDPIDMPIVKHCMKKWILGQ